MANINVYERVKLKKRSKSDVTLAEAAGLIGSKSGYRLSRGSNGRRDPIVCLVEVTAVDPRGSVLVKILDSEEFKVKVSSLVGL